MTTIALNARSQAVADYFVADPIELLDDIIQLLSDAGHEDLVDDIAKILYKLDSRRARAHNARSTNAV